MRESKTQRLVTCTCRTSRAALPAAPTASNVWLRAATSLPRMADWQVLGPLPTIHQPHSDQDPVRRDPVYPSPAPPPPPPPGLPTEKFSFGGGCYHCYVRPWIVSRAATSGVPHNLAKAANLRFRTLMNPTS